MSFMRRPFSWPAILFLIAVFLGPVLAAGFPRATIEDPMAIGSDEPKTSEPESGSTNEDESGSSSGTDSWYTGTDITDSSSGDEDSPSLFSDSHEYKELAEKVSDVLDAYASTSTSTSTTATGTSTAIRAAMITPTVAASEAALGCTVVQSYISLCSSSVIPTRTSGAPAKATDQALASCACYSASYFVPAAFDSALLACAGYTTAFTSAMPTAGLAALATSASRMEGFCATMSNPRSLPTTQFGKATATSSSDASETSNEVTSQSSDADRLGAAGMSLWVAVAASMMLF